MSATPPAKRLRPDEGASQFADDPRLEREHANAKSVIRGVAQEFVCPIDQTPVYDAVLAADGCVYERFAIEQYVGAGARDCPQSGTSHKISIVSLKPAKEFTRWKKVKARLAARRRGEGGEGGDSDVVSP